MKQLICFLLGFNLAAIGVSQDAQGPAEPKSIILTTKDNVRLHLQYFAGQSNKQTVPIILIHGTEGTVGSGSSQDVKQLALVLQRSGHSVFAPDLRGFGASTERAGRQDGLLNRKRFNRNDIANMVKMDMEAVKRFIVERHDAGELNVEQLCLVGFELGSIIALDWARLDWNAPSFPGLKQGQDVKTMVLVSPIPSHVGFSFANAIADKHVQSSIATMLAVGARSNKSTSHAKRIFKRFERAHRYAGEGRRNYETLAYHELPTSLQGTKLLAANTFNLSESIRDFINGQVARNAEQYPWKPRKRK